MSYDLIISEKPDAARKIAEALADGKAIKEAQKGVPTYKITRKGKDIVVACAVGHLYSVAEKKKSFVYPSYDIHWVPTSEVDKNAAFSKKYFDAIKKAAKGATSFTVACDYDIEGEVIGLNIIRELCKQKDASRMKFSTLTTDDLRDAYDKRQNHLDWGQAKAGETRHFLDWMYGINLSRALMHAVKTAGGFKVLSSGRVQGPALKIIVDKEREIQAFVPEPYWQLELLAESAGEAIEAMHEEERFKEKAKAKKAHDKAAKAKEALVKSVDQKEFKQAPPTPFDLGSLQAESYALFNIGPKHTLQIAQSLYLAGVTSYPRTSSQRLPPEIGYKKILTQLAKQAAYKDRANTLLALPALKPAEGKKTDPAHPAIYPTGLPFKAGSEQEKKVYDLIVKRFFAVFGKAATRSTITAKFDAGGEIFVAKGTTTKEKGWHELYEPYVKLKETQLPALKNGQKVKVKEVTFEEKETTPPKRYTPSSIVTELEKRSLGTKATRADIVESLYQRGYIDEKSIQATELGLKTISTLEKYCPEIIDEELTKSFEEEMEKIREDQIKPDAVLAHARKELDKTLTHFKKNEKLIGEELLAADRETKDIQATLGACPRCGQGSLRITYSKKTRKRFAGCSRYPDCDLTMPLPQTGMLKSTEKVCEHDKFPIVKIQAKGKKPQELCLNIECPGKRGSKKEEAALVKEGEKKICPKCGKHLILRRSIYGEFFGCSGYPACRHIERIPKKEDQKKDVPAPAPDSE